MTMKSACYVYYVPDRNWMKFIGKCKSYYPLALASDTESLKKSSEIKKKKKIGKGKCKPQLLS